MSLLIKMCNVHTSDCVCLLVSRTRLRSILPRVVIHQGEICLLYYGQPTIVLYPIFSCLIKIMF